MDTRKPLKHEDFVAELLSDDATRQAYEALEPEYALLDELLRARVAAGLTQQEVAKRMHTTQPTVARLESADPKHSPKLDTLRRYAAAVNRRLEIRLVEAAPSRPGAVMARAHGHERGNGHR